MLLEIFTLVVIAVILAAIFFYGFRRTGPWGSFWTFLLILICGMLLFTVWTDPYGPVFWGISWFDMLIIGLLLSLLLAAASPSRRDSNKTKRDEILPTKGKTDLPDRIALSGFFWILLILFAILIIIGLL